MGSGILFLSAHYLTPEGFNPGSLVTPARRGISVHRSPFTALADVGYELPALRGIGRKEKSDIRYPSGI